MEIHREGFFYYYYSDNSAICYFILRKSLQQKAIYPHSLLYRPGVLFFYCIVHFEILNFLIIQTFINIFSTHLCDFISALLSQMLPDRKQSCSTRPRSADDLAFTVYLLVGTRASASTVSQSLRESGGTGKPRRSQWAPNASFGQKLYT